MGFAPSKAQQKSFLAHDEDESCKKSLDAEPRVMKNVSYPPILISLISQDKW